MTRINPRILSATLLQLMAACLSSQAATIVQNTGGPGFTINSFAGQSFTTPATGGTWNHLTFNFFSPNDASSVAAGTAYLLPSNTPVRRAT